MQGVKLWWGLTEKMKPVLWLAWTFALSTLGFPELGESWFRFAWVLLCVVLIMGMSWRFDAGYAALNLPLKIWRGHQRIDTSLILVSMLTVILCRTSWGSPKQIFFLLVVLAAAGRHLFGRTRQASSYLGESLASRLSAHASAEEPKKKKDTWIPYPETLLGQSILRLQLGFSVGLVVATLIGAFLSRFISWIFHTPPIPVSGGLLVVVWMFIFFFGLDRIQDSYWQWIRFGGSRTQWARWTAVINVGLVLVAIAVGTVAGIIVGEGLAQGALVGAMCGIYLIPVLILSAVGGRHNWFACCVFVLGMASVLVLFGMDKIGLNQWLLLQGGLTAFILLLLPRLVRHAGHELRGLSAFFGTKART